MKITEQCLRELGAEFQGGPRHSWLLRDRGYQIVFVPEQGRPGVWSVEIEGETTYLVVSLEECFGSLIHAGVLLGKQRVRADVDAMLKDVAAGLAADTEQEHRWAAHEMERKRLVAAQ